jgi:hypothetical protein
VTDASEKEGKGSSRPRMIKRVIDWDKKKDDQGAKEMIADLAIFLSKVRGSAYAYQSKVMTSLANSKLKDSISGNDDDDTGSGYQYEYAHSKPLIEKPKRPANVLRNIAISHSFELYGRDHITYEDLPILVKIVLSSANRERIAVIKTLLLAPKGISGLIPSEFDTTRDIDINHLVGTNYLISKTGISQSQVQRIVTELEILGYP